MKRVLIVGSAEKSAGGVASVIRLMKKMPVWEEFHCYWLGTQIQRNYAWKLWYALKAYFAALFIIWRYDIVHFHTVPDSICLVIQLPVFLLALLGRKKIILHLHVGNQLEREQEQKNKLFRWCMMKADVIVLLAHRFENILKELYEEITTPTVVIYNPCDKVSPIPYYQHNKTILYAGAFTHNKAVDVLIDAFSIVHKKHPDWRLQLLGSGSEERLYRKKIKDYHIEKNVEMPGYLTGKAKSIFFQKAGIYTMCSYLEGLPMVVIEAWSYGVPVVSTPVGGLSELLSEGNNCFSFDFGSVDELAKKLDLLMGNYEMREKMSAFSIDFAAQNFSMNVINNHLLKLYKQLM